ncbi:MAG: hypothetical protein DLM70_15745 [Chloroflexi bacterium]|nr:MAG: hypothetical protein DLM70_15745 [Chloroflexota bacterium]
MGNLSNDVTERQEVPESVERSDPDQQDLITVVSTHTNDSLVDSDGVRREMPGGPAFYIARAFDRLGQRYRLITGEIAQVNVLRRSHGEEYSIGAIPLISLPRAIRSQATLLSPVVREIDPEALPPIAGLLAVDLQGFVREPMKPFRDVTRLFSLAHLLDRAGLVKAGEAEVERLDRPSRRALDSCTTMVTRGSRGIILRQRGRERKIAVSRVEAEQTIGAGDTLLAAMVVGLLDGFDVGEAALRASDFASRSLREREKT